MGIVELDRKGSHDVSVALEFVKQDMVRAKEKFTTDVQKGLGVEKWEGDSKIQFDRAVRLIEGTMRDLTTAVDNAKNAFIEMGETIRKADAHCADGIF